jgi:hypothetical protein
MIKPIFKKQILRTLPALVVLISLAAPTLPHAGAQTLPQPQMQMPQFQQIPLSADIVEKFLESLPHVRASVKNLEKQHNIQPDGGLNTTLDAINAQMAATGQLNSVSQEYGFASFEEWSQTAQSIFLAHSANQMEAEGQGSINTQMQKALDEIRNDPSMSDSQKQMIISMMEQQFQSMSQLEPLPGNKEAVVPYADELEKAADEE